MKRLILILFVFLSIQAQAQQDTLLKILGWGLAGSSENIIEGVTKKYGFEYYSVGGCVIPWELQDSVKKHNDSIYAILTQRNGPDWQERFQEDVENLYLHKDELKALVLREPLVKGARTVLYLEFEPASDKDTFKVRVLGYDEGEWKLFYTYHVDHKKKKTALLLM